MAEAELYYIYKPEAPRDVAPEVEFRSVQEFLADEPACKALWNFLSQQFNTRSKFLSIWPCVRHVVTHRKPDGIVDGLLLVTTPVNWQIDYVVVDPESRGKKIATKMTVAALDYAYRAKVPYVMLTSKESLRPLYEGCGFQVVERRG